MLGIDMVWATAGGFLPPLLERFGAKPFLLGLLMSAGPFTGIIVQPLAGLLSDRLHTGLGRRLPFIIAGAPIVALSLAGMGFAHTLPLACFYLSIFCIALNAYQGPYRAILGDEIAPEQHALASSFQNLSSGLGMMLAFTAGAWLIRVSDGGPFFLAAIMVFASAGWTCLAMRNNISSPVKTHAKRESIWQYLRNARNLRWLFGAQFCWWFAIQAASTFAVLFAVHDLKGIKDLNSPQGKAAIGDSVLLLAIVTITVLFSALPVAVLAQKHGKKLILSIGLAIMMIGFLIAGLATSIAQTYLVMALFGLGFACVQVIPYTILTELQPAGHEGVLAGVFNIFIGLAQLTSVTAVGALVQRYGSYRIAFWVGLASLACAILILQPLKLPAQHRPRAEN